MTSQSHFPTIRDLPRSPFRKIIDGFLNLIYPETCFICSTPVSRGQDCGICDLCRRKIMELRITVPCCASCGLPLPNFAESGNLCLECVRTPPPYSGARSFGYYSAEMRQLIHALKFDGRMNLAALLGTLVSTAFFDSWKRDDFDFITAIPLHPKRRRERGFNQSELLARALERETGIPRVRVLRRVAPTRPQVGLSNAQRRENTRNAFRCVRPARITGRRILLIDDVMTTGATASSAAQALQTAGAKKVSVLTAARATR